LRFPSMLSVQLVRSLHLSRPHGRLPTFERHLREQALWTGVSPNQVPAGLRRSIEEALRAQLGQRGLPADGTRAELRARIRVAELLDAAKTLSIPSQGDDIEAVRRTVFDHYRGELRVLGLPTRGSLATMQRRLARGLAKQKEAEKEAAEAAAAKKKAVK